MESILHLPRWDVSNVQARLGQLQQRLELLQRRLDTATAGERRLISPLNFFAAAAVIGVAAIVATVYTPAYVVTQNGVVLGTVSDPQVFEDVVDRVEDRASEILGYEYTLDGEVTYDFALTEPENITPTAQFTTACAPIPVSAHTWQSCSCYGTSVGTKGMVKAGEAMALAGLSLFTDKKDVIEKAKEELKADLDGATYTPIPDDMMPYYD